MYNGPMASLHRLESVTPDRTVGGVLITWDDDPNDVVRKVCSWRSGEPVDVPQTARKLVEGVIEELRAMGRMDLIEWTNWVSLTAGICTLVAGWNDGLPGA